MFYFLRFKICFFICIALFPFNKLAYAVNAEPSNACNATGNLFNTGETACRFTPSKYESTIFEMGVCQEHPFLTDDFDRSTCSTTFLATDQTSGFTADFAESLGGTVTLEGVSTRPANGTYKYPFIILKNRFTLQGTFTNDSNTYYIKSDGTVQTNGTDPAVDRISDLVNFGDDTCDGEYLNATVDVGTISGYLTNTTLNKADTSNITGSSPNRTCDSTYVTRLVGIINLSVPFTISPSTMGMKFNFNVTGYGAQLFGSTDTPQEAGSGPFSGSFTITDAPAQ